jgi:Domain of unknown function (DUF4360)
MKMSLKILGLCLGLMSTVAMAQVDPNDVTLGVPSYGGNGCPSGSASVTLGSDAKTLSILFDSFMVEAGGANPATARKSCNITIPVRIPQGYSVSIITADYRGYVSLPAQAQARMSAEYFFAGSNTVRFEKVFNGRTDTDYLFTNRLGVEAVVWTPCGASPNLRVNAAMLVKTNRFGDDALATVDSADFSSGIIYQLQWKRCR